MTKTAVTGPIIAYGQRLPLGNAGPTNPDLATSLGYAGWGIIDPRLGYNVSRAGVLGYFGDTAITVVDQVPYTATANNIAASQAVTAGTAMTLVSSSGTGITVLAAATTYWPAGNSLPSGTLALDTAPALIACGTANVASGNTLVSLYDPAHNLSRNVRVTTNADDTGGYYTVAGWDIYGYPMTEKITGVNNAVASGKKAFKFVGSVTPGGTLNSTAVTVGTGDVYGFPLRVDLASHASVFWNGSLMIGNSPATQSTMIIPVQLADLANSATWAIGVPFDFTYLAAGFRTGKPASTSSKASTLTVQVNGTSVSGNTMALTTANQNATGTLLSVATPTVTSGSAGQTIGFVPSSTTAFVEGDGWVEFTVQNNDLGGGTFTAAVTTTASSTTGDVRGTITLPSASNNSNRLVIVITPGSTLAQSTTGLFGVTQA